jgi:hypothetical protein
MQKYSSPLHQPEIQYLEAGGGRGVRLEARQRRARRRQFRMQHGTRARVIDQIHVASGLCVCGVGGSSGGGRQVRQHIHKSNGIHVRATKT